MACFIVPMGEAVVTTIITKVVSKKEKENNESKVYSHECLSKKLNRLNGLLWGGSALLAFEHLWHGEIQPFFPFLTAAGDADAMAEVLHEMSTVGVGMAVAVTVAWGIMCIATDMLSKREEADTVNS